jgi:hypothetical protein
MMWLTNRQGTRWRWRNSLDLSNSDGSFAMFTSACRAVDAALEGEYRVITPAKRLAKDPK